MDLNEAIRAGDLTLVEAAVARDRAVAGGTTGSGVPLTLFAMYCGQQEIATLLARHKLALTLHECAALGRLEEARNALLRDPLSLDAHSNDGFTPLMLAAFFGRPTIVRWLLERGAVVNVASRNAMRVTALHAAAASAHTEVVRALLAAGADADARQERGWTPLHTAADVGDADMVRALLDAGADPGATNDDGVVALETASAKGHDEVVRILRDARDGELPVTPET